MASYLTEDVTSTQFEQFVAGFRDEHRLGRDVLMGMSEAFQQRDTARIGQLFSQFDTGIGPHMRYEEETMYPALVETFGPEYIEKMLQDHDRALGTAGRLMELASHDPITEGDVREAQRLLRGLLPHVSDCDGLAIILERLPAEKQQAIAESRDRAVRDGTTVMQWAERRGRTPLPPA